MVCVEEVLTDSRMCQIETDRALQEIPAGHSNGILESRMAIELDSSLPFRVSTANPRGYILVRRYLRAVYRSHRTEGEPYYDKLPAIEDVSN